MLPVTVTKKSPIGAAYFHRHDPEAVHDGLKAFQRVDFRDDDISPHAFRAHGDAASAPAIAYDDNDRTAHRGDWSPE